MQLNEADARGVHLENQFQSTLDLSGSGCGRCDQARRRAELRSRTEHDRIRRAKIRPIQEVEELRSELKQKTLT